MPGGGELLSADCFPAPPVRIAAERPRLRLFLRIPELQMTTLARSVDGAARLGDAVDALGVDRAQSFHRRLVQHVRVRDECRTILADHRLDLRRLELGLRIQ